MNAYLVIGLAGLAIVCAVFAWSACHINKGHPTPKPLDVIDDEIRAERLELHNASCDYGERNRGICEDHTPDESHAQSVEMMLAAAFRQGALWQQRRE